MSFMFKPLAYDEMNAINTVSISDSQTAEIKTSSEQIAEGVLKTLSDITNKVVLIDGYIGADFTKMIQSINQINQVADSIRFIDISEYYKAEEEIKELVKDSLPEDYEEDPVLLFGKLYQGTFESFFNQEALETLISELKNTQVQTIVYGHGSTIKALRQCAGYVIYMDVIPKVAAIRAKEEKYKNIGMKEKLPFNLLMRRNYYVDFEIVLKLRKELLQEQAIDEYLMDSNRADFYSMPKKVLKELLRKLAEQPFRTKPVYLEGIWGGEFIRKVRNLPQNISPNVAWVFDFIPMEVSVAIDANGKYLEFPFSTFMQSEGASIVGKEAYEKFGGYFPIRFNYDDTWHSNGNMSIQVHPGQAFVKEHYDESFGQDESYYVVSTGHKAATYCGFKDDKGEEFLNLCEKSEKDGSMIEYHDYVNQVPSVPGRQFMLPSGTIHASGQNQIILEIGSLTMGSYTYKVYDYNRKDRDGKQRPIHTKNAKQVLAFDRDQDYVKKNLVIDPILVEQQETAEEWIVGDTDLMYFQTRRIELETHGKYEGHNNKQFTVLTLVDGEKALIYSKTHPEFSYEAHFLDIIVVPASIDDYVIEAQGYQPVVMHKTILK